MLEAPETEKRASARRRTLKSGKIVFNNRNSTIDCTVRNLSDTGAKLVVASALGIPDSFELAISGEPPRTCRVARRTLTEIGVEFSLLSAALRF